MNAPDDAYSDVIGEEPRNSRVVTDPVRQRRTAPRPSLARTALATRCSLAPGEADKARHCLLAKIEGASKTDRRVRVYSIFHTVSYTRRHKVSARGPRVCVSNTAAVIACIRPILHSVRLSRQSQSRKSKSKSQEAFVLEFPILDAHRGALERKHPSPARGVLLAVRQHAVQLADRRARAGEVDHPRAAELLLGALDRLRDVGVDRGEHVAGLALLVPAQAERVARDVGEQGEAGEAHAGAVEGAGAGEHRAEVRPGAREPVGGLHEEADGGRERLGVHLLEPAARDGGECRGYAVRTRCEQCAHDGAEAVGCR